MFQLYVVMAAVCVTCAGLAAAVPSYYAAEHQDAAAVEHHEPHHHRSYHFQYAVHDPHTGDVHSQNEVNDGHGTVKGTYSLVEPDGSTRVVEYTADDEHGFNAEVKRIEPLHHVKPAPAAYDKPAPVHQTDADDGHQLLHHYLPAELFSSH